MQKRCKYFYKYVQRFFLNHKNNQYLSEVSKTVHQYFFYNVPANTIPIPAIVWI